MATALPSGTSMPTFDTSAGDAAVRWRKYLNRFQNMMVAYAIQDPAQQIALLLHLGGEDLHEVYDSLPEAEKQATPAVDGQGGQNIFQAGCKALTAYFAPRVNTEFQKYEFRRTAQKENEPLDTCGSFESTCRHMQLQ